MAHNLLRTARRSRSIPPPVSLCSRSRSVVFRTRRVFSSSPTPYVSRTCLFVRRNESWKGRVESIFFIFPREAASVDRYARPGHHRVRFRHRERVHRRFPQHTTRCAPRATLFHPETPNRSSLPRRLPRFRHGPRETQGDVRHHDHP